MEPDAFYAAAARKFDEAAARAGVEDLPLAVAGRRVRLRLAGRSLQPIVKPVFLHLAAAGEHAAAAVAGLTIGLWDCDETGAIPPPQPWARAQVGVLGRVSGYGDGAFEIAVEGGGRQVWMFDRARGRALAWFRDVAGLPPWDRYCPLRQLFGTWAGALGLQMVHGGTVGFDGAGALVVGPGGAGKSTTVLASIAAGAQSVGDDYVLVGETPPCAHSLYGAMRLYESHARRFPALLPGDDWRAPGHDGTPKITTYVSVRRPAGMVASLPLAAIIVPRVVGTGRTRIERTSGGAALFALAPNTVAQVEPRGRATFDRLARLCRALPSWRLLLGDDVAEIPAQIRRALALSAGALVA